MATEEELRDMEAPRPETIQKLDEFINGLVELEHDYGTCVYAMSLSAMAAYNYVAKKLGVTGFQASCADLDFIRQTRNLKGPFALIDGNKMLFPQYDILQEVAQMLIDWGPWATEEAKKKLMENSLDHVNPDVRAHWEKLAAIVHAEETNNG